MDLGSEQGACERTGITHKCCLGLACWAACSACFGQAPPNDDFTNAIPLYGNSVIFSGTLSNATFESEEYACPCDKCFPGGSVWWSWTATNSTAVVIDTVQHSSVGWVGFAAHTGTNVDALADVGCNLMDFIPNRYMSFPATAGTTYHIRVLGDTADSFVLRLTATNSPVILRLPQDQTVRENASAFFSVFAAGLRPLSYQWQFEGNSLAGQTTPCLVLNYAGTSQAGGYSLVVSNATGVITSAVANLTVSPTNPPLLLKALGTSETNRFDFSLTGETGQVFRVWATTNLINWSDEESLLPDLNYPPFYGYALVQNSNATSVFSIPMVATQQMIRVSRHMHKEICITNLKEIDFALKLWATEGSKESSAAVGTSDILPYLNNNTHSVVCPSYGTSFNDSYSITTPWYAPTCQKSTVQHVLP